MDTETLRREFDAASERLKKRAAEGMGQIGSRTASENRYTQAYQALVSAGLEPQIRAKYR